jgi:hypothetical protein
MGEKEKMGEKEEKNKKIHELQLRFSYRFAELRGRTGRYHGDQLTSLYIEYSAEERGEAPVVKLCSPKTLSGFLRFFNLYDKS